MYALLIFDYFSVLYGFIPSCTFIIFQSFPTTVRFFYVIHNVSVKIQVFFKSKGKNEHENEKNKHFLRVLDLNNLGHFAPVRLFHPVCLLVFRKYATLYGYSILYLYLILKST